MIGPDQCRRVEVDGEIIRVHGEREMDDADQAALTEVVRAVVRAAKLWLDERAAGGRR